MSGVKFAARPGELTERELLRDQPGVVLAEKIVDFREAFEKRNEFVGDKRIRLGDKDFRFSVVGRISPNATVAVKSGFVGARLPVVLKTTGKFGFFLAETVDKFLRFGVLRRVRPTVELRKNGVTERDKKGTGAKNETTITRKGLRRLRPTLRRFFLNPSGSRRCAKISPRRRVRLVLSAARAVFSSTSLPGSSGTGGATWRRREREREGTEDDLASSMSGAGDGVGDVDVASFLTSRHSSGAS